MTKNIVQRFIPLACAALLGLAATSYASAPSINVTVFDAGGKVAYRSPMKANAAFTTGNLRPGNYVVQFNSTTSAPTESEYLIVVSSGQRKVIANGVAAEKLTGGGVAMKVAVRGQSSITGQLANVTASVNDANVRVKDGKRYSWVTAETGSNLGGRWVEEGVGGTRPIVRWDSDEIRLLQDRSDEGSVSNRVGKRTKFTGL